MNFDEMVQFEGQAHGAYFSSVEQYLELAIDLAVRDTIKHQVYQGSLIRQNTVSFLTSSSSAYPSCRPLTTPMKYTLNNAYFASSGDSVISMCKGFVHDRLGF